jgi:hypothetical protein
MKMNPAHWGVIVAALLLSTPVASQEIKCKTVDDCPDMQYCNSVIETCMSVGSCVEPKDCQDLTNSPFPMIECMGSITCNGGMCGIDCGVFPDEYDCNSIEDCPDNMYCNSISKKCMDMGACVEPNDCSDPTNGPYAQILCMGTQICASGRCSIDCGVFPEDDPGGSMESPVGLLCSSDADCAQERGEYCASDGRCEEIGGCAIVDDCFNDANKGYPIAPCMGGMECNDRVCGMNCYGGSDALFACEKAKDCPQPDDYCNSYKFCRPSGACNSDPDCFLPDNSYPEIACVGETKCDMGTCRKSCSLPEQETTKPTKCKAISDCEPDQFCTGNGYCRPSGSCDSVADCEHPDNDVFLPFCVGTVTCEANQCGKVCNGEVTVTPPESGAEDESAVDINVVVSCTSDEDCITTSTERNMGIEKYCAQGVCTNHGRCFSDEDCINPANFIYFDKKCMGYQFCDEEGMCDRECGERCKNGSRGVDCFTNPCDNVDLESCGAARCAMRTCDGECSSLLFDAAGKVMTSCDVTAASRPELERGETTSTEKASGESPPVDSGVKLPTLEEPDALFACEKAKDCPQPDDYCDSKKFCRPSGSCNSDPDCFLPGNWYIVAACTGETNCSIGGMCSRTCFTTPYPPESSAIRATSILTIVAAVLATAIV